MNHTEFCMLSHLTVSGRFYTQFLPVETKGQGEILLLVYAQTFMSLN